MDGRGISGYEADDLNGVKGGRAVGLSITRKVEVSTVANRVRMDRGDGRLFNVNAGDVDEFKKNNPGAFVVPTPNLAAAAAAATPQEKASTLDGMTVAQLKAHAEEHEVDLEGASTKADIIAAIKAGGAE